MDDEVKAYVKKRYGDISRGETSCCSSCEPSPKDVAFKLGYSRGDLEGVPESSIMGLGCGNPTALANLRQGERVLDLGSGGGIDVFLAAKKVGPKGFAIGVDMTEEMVNRAKANASQRQYKNVEFRLGEIEKLPVEDSSIDVIISNCVINLSPDKERVFREAHRVLRPGGRIIISDLVTEGELPEEIRKSFEAWAGCIAGALEKTQYLNTIRKAGFKSVKILSESTYDVDVSSELRGKVTSIQVEARKTL
ncbi:MAG: arsenite methyltransferase [Candidatus Bathyarchaeota archaeon]|nr:arsenite methyltransferase [Candidatus Bathyarchaeota archaeon]